MKNERNTYTSIESIEDQQDHDNNHHQAMDTSSSSSSSVITTKKVLLLAALGTAAFFGFASFPSKSEILMADMPAELMGNAEVVVKHCSATECFKASCDKSLAPFICLFNNGGPHNGCSVIPWVEGTCDVQCDLSFCNPDDIPEGTVSCKGAKCDPEVCKGGQVCGSSAPYQCRGGSATFGCSSDPLEWTLRTSDSTCSGCCDYTTCE